MFSGFLVVRQCRRTNACVVPKALRANNRGDKLQVFHTTSKDNGFVLIYPDKVAYILDHVHVQRRGVRSRNGLPRAQRNLPPCKRRSARYSDRQLVFPCLSFFTFLVFPCLSCYISLHPRYIFLCPRYFPGIHDMYARHVPGVCVCMARAGVRVSV